MRNPQSFPDSPATQPYNQGVKPLTMQQPMGYPASGNAGFQVGMNPNTGFANQPSPQPAMTSPEPVSPTPNYQFQPSVPPHTQPVTPTSLYGQATGTNPGYEMQQQQPATPPGQFATPVSNPGPNIMLQQPITPPGQFATPTSNPGPNTMLQQPVTPPGQFATPASNPGPNTMLQQPVTLPGQFATPSSNLANTMTPNENAGVVSPAGHTKTDTEGSFDFFGGPPMGSPVGGNTLADAPGTAPPAPPSNADTQYQGVLQGMNTLTVRPGQSQPYQNYSLPENQVTSSPQSAHQNNSDFQQPPYSPTEAWAAPQQQDQQPAYQSFNQQQYSPTPDWNPFAQPPQQQPYPAQANGVWSGNTFAGGHNQHQLPSNHPVPSYDSSPYGAQQHGYAPQGFGYETTGYGQEESEETKDTAPAKACADHKSSTDVTREYGAGLRALRLLDETTTGYNDEDDYPRRGGGIRSAAKHEHAKHLKAKQIRKMKKREYKNKMTEMLAESSRPVQSVRKGYDPELTSDKCQLDFDRQRDAQVKALKLMSNMF